MCTGKSRYRAAEAASVDAAVAGAGVQVQQAPQAQQAQQAHHKHHRGLPCHAKKHRLT